MDFAFALKLAGHTDPACPRVTLAHSSLELVHALLALRLLCFQQRTRLRHHSNLSEHVVDGDQQGMLRALAVWGFV